MAKTVTMDSLMTELSGALGETSVPTSGVDNRKTFLQRSYEDAWKLYPFPFTMTDTTLDFSSGVAELPDDFLEGGHCVLLNDGKEVGQIDFADQGTAQPGFYIRYNSGTYEAVLLNVADGSYAFRYQYETPDLTQANASGPYPNPTTIVKGAIRYVVKADNPEADNAQEIATFTAACQEDYAPFNRSRMRHRRATSIAEIYGHAPGAE